MKTETCLTQPKYLLIAIFIQLPAPPPILITVHVDYVQSYQATYFYHLSFSWISGGFMQFWLYHLKGCVGKSPTKWHLISSPILLLLKEAESNLLGESCHLSDVTLRLFSISATLHYFVHATCQEDNNVFGSTLKPRCLLLYWGKVSVVNPDCFGFACMYESLHLVSINGLTATHLQ